jgi:hypothetical protein
MWETLNEGECLWSNYLKSNNLEDQEGNVRNFRCKEWGRPRMSWEVDQHNGKWKEYAKTLFYSEEV